VDGVYTTDPNVAPGARRIEKISFDEMLEMASLGAKVLQTRSVEFGKKYDMPILVRSTFEEGGGTLVTHETREMEEVVVSAVAFERDQAKVTLMGVADRPGIAAKIFGAVADASINVDMIIQNVAEGVTTDMSFTVPKSDAKKTVTAMNEMMAELGATNVSVDDNIGKVSIIGVGMRSHTGIAAKAFAALAEGGINIMMISTSEIKVSCVIKAEEIDRAVRILHDIFELALPPGKRKN
jgi:aspartate kinase